MAQETLPGAIHRKTVGRAAAVAIAATLAAIPSLGVAEILWSGDYRGGDFRQWHKWDDQNTVTFHMIPDYGRPIQYGGQASSHVGNGDLLSLVSKTQRTVDGIFYPEGPTRGRSEYAAKFRVKNSKSGSEPADCDDGVCKRRRTELTVQATLPAFYNALDYKSDRWISISHFLPENWEDAGSGSGVQVFQIKPRKDGGGIGACIGIEAVNGHWEVEHSWTDILDYRDQIPYQQAPKYSPTYPVAGDVSGDLLGDFPDVSASRAALKDLNKGGWTDWVFHVVFDARGSLAGGQGLLEVWKRAGSGPWVKVLHIVPKVVTVSGLTYDRGICYNSPDGFGIKAGMYMSKGQVWNLERDRVLYNANIKVGSASTPFSTMSPDGSEPGEAVAGDPVPEEAASPPKPPSILR